MTFTKWVQIREDNFALNSAMNNQNNEKLKSCSKIIEFYCISTAPQLNKQQLDRTLFESFSPRANQRPEPSPAPPPTPDSQGGPRTPQSNCSDDRTGIVTSQGRQIMDSNLFDNLFRN